MQHCPAATTTCPSVLVQFMTHSDSIEAQIGIDFLVELNDRIEPLSLKCRKETFVDLAQFFYSAFCLNTHALNTKRILSLIN